MLRLDAVSAAEHRDRELVGNPRHEIPVGPAAVALRRRPPMDGDGGRTRVLDHLRQGRRVYLGIVPAGPHLHRHRNFHRFGHRGNHRGRVRRLAHQAAAGMVLRNLGHRTAHVDVHDVGAHAFDDLRRRRHLVGISAEDLDRDGPLRLCVLGVLERSIDPANEPLRAHHLGDDEAAAAVAFDETAKRRVGHAGHWGHGKGGREVDGAYLHKGAFVAGP